ncbi:GNAT family N-acetyltransferase [Myroides odoratus]|uniref:GNAT family N-acetyltransferase n=1 Tax=Myroides odoratus TaxID=256 RepID=UPI0039AF9C97
MELIAIERITSKEVHLLQEISIKTFIETFAVYNKKEDMDKYITENLSIETLIQELDQEESMFYFVNLGQITIGYLKLNTGTAQTEHLLLNSLEIERIYVHQAYHGKKIGQILLEQALQVAQNLKVTSVWLGVWERNQRAIRFYEKNGFKVFDQHQFQLGDDLQTDWMMKKNIE